MSVEIKDFFWIFLKENPKKISSNLCKNSGYNCWNQIFEDNLEKSWKRKNLEEKKYYQIYTIWNDYDNNFLNQRFESYPEKSWKNPEYGKISGK